MAVECVESWYVYGLRHKNSIGVYRYIGITTRTPARRMSDHLRSARNVGEIKSNTPKDRWIAKNIPNIVMDIIEEIPLGDIDSLFFRECFWIATMREKFGDLWSKKENRNLNILDGGNLRLGYTHSAETREKISKANSGTGNARYGLIGHNNPLYGVPLSKEHRDNISKSKIGERNPQFGVPHTEETKNKLSKSMKKVSRPENYYKINSSKGNHTRHHTNKNVVNPECPLCQEVDKTS